MSFHATLAGVASVALGAGAADALAAGVGADVSAGGGATVDSALGAGIVAAGCDPPHENTVGPKQLTNITIQPFDLRFIESASFPSAEGSAALDN